jgi:hypothetical protein
LLALWEPSSNTLKNLTSSEPQLFQNGLGAMARTGDHTQLLVAASDSSGGLAVYNSSGSVVAGPHSAGTGTIPLVAANSDGSMFAEVLVSNGASQVLLLDNSLNQVAVHAASAVFGVVFSGDGQFLYVSEDAGAPPVISVLDAHTLTAIGQVPDLWIAGKRSEIEDVDATNLLFGVANRGLSFVDAASPIALSGAAPVFAAAPTAQPSEGPNAGGTMTVLTGQNFRSNAQVLFGTQSGSSATVASGTQINVTSPPNASAGAVNIAAYFPSGWLAIAPDAFSYGPQVLQILPNAGTSAGGDIIRIYGYGFGSDPTKITVKIAGATATVQQTQNVVAVGPSLGLDSTYPFPLECITLQTPAGTAGKFDNLLTH